MLQKIRDKTQGLISNIMMGLLISVFAFWGVDTLVGNLTQNTPKLVVNGDEITAEEIDRLTQRKTQEAISKMGDKPDVSKLDEAALRVSAVNELIQRKLLEQSASNNGMGVSARGIDRSIAQNTDFQIDGAYNAERAAAIIQSQGLTPAGYRALIGRELLLNQQLAAFTATGFSTPDQISRVAALVHQKRSLRFVVVNTGKYADAVTVTDQDVQDYYQQHQASFRQQEQVRIEYVELDKSKLADAAVVTDEQLQTAYKDEVAGFKAQTERRASHILLQATTDAQLADARKKAADIKAKLDAGDDFAKLAAQYSQDTGSAKTGGDVGYTTGSAFADTFEAALRELKVNQVSEPVQTEFGIHLIKLTETKETKIDPFEKRKDDLLHNLKQKAAEAQFKAKADELKTLAFESPDLSEPASKLQLAKQTTDWFTRSGGAGISEEAAVRTAAFTTEVKDQGLNSEVVSIDANRSVVLHVLEHQPDQVRPLDVVRGEVEVVLRLQKATEQAKTMGETLIKSLKAGEKVDEVLTAQKLAWAQLDGIERVESRLNPEIADILFTMQRPEQDKTVVQGFALRNGDYVVAELLSVADGKLTDVKDAEAESMRSFVSQQAGASDFTSFMRSIEARAKIKGKDTQLAVKDPLL